MAQKKTTEAEAMEAIKAAVADNWDTETRTHQINDLSFHLAGTTGYIPARLKEQMDRDNGVPVTHIRTKTFTDTGKVWISPCVPGTPGARPLRMTSTMGAAEVGFAIPLRKLNLKIPVSRQMVFKVKPVPVENGSPVYEISFETMETFRRDVDEAAIAAAKRARAEKAKARRAERSAPAQKPVTN